MIYVIIFLRLSTFSCLHISTISDTMLRTYTLPSTPPPVLYLSLLNHLSLLCKATKASAGTFICSVKVYTRKFSLKFWLLDLCGADANNLAYFTEEEAIYFYVTICHLGKIFIPGLVNQWWYPSGLGCFRYWNSLFTKQRFPFLHNFNGFCQSSILFGLNWSILLQ